MKNNFETYSVKVILKWKQDEEKTFCFFEGCQKRPFMAKLFSQETKNIYFVCLMTYISLFCFKLYNENHDQYY